MFKYFYRPRYYLTHPLTFIGDVFSNLKWAWQRVTRGWDDTAVWSIDCYVVDTMIPMLKRLKDCKAGYPLEFCGEGESEAWNKVIDEMIAGFEAAERMNSDDIPGTEKYNADMKLFMRGMHLFTKYFFALWS